MLVFLADRMPCAVQYALARMLAYAYYLLHKPAREAVLANLRVILGPNAPVAEVRRQALGVFRSFARYLCEFFGYRRFGPEYLARSVRITGRERLDAALARGKGVLLVSGHYSNWELGASVVGQLGYPIRIVAQMHADPRVNALFVAMRAKHGVEVAHTESGARAALKALRANRPVAILGDRPTGGPTEPVALFGREVPFPQGPWRIALATGAPILPTFVSRQPDGAYALDFGAPLALPGQDGKRAQIQALAQSFAQVLEARIAADPGQWETFYTVWPEDAKAVRKAKVTEWAEAHA